MGVDFYSLLKFVGMFSEKFKIKMSLGQGDGLFSVWFYCAGEGHQGIEERIGQISLQNGMRVGSKTLVLQLIALLLRTIHAL